MRNNTLVKEMELFVGLSFSSNLKINTYNNKKWPENSIILIMENQWNNYVNILR
jgi:hypothetical protein